MTPEKKKRRQLRNLALLSLLLLLVGGTFAFQAFNQRAINDRIRENSVGGRTHDYYNRDTENKDVFVENFGDVEIMVRIRLSEFMEIQRGGTTGFEPLVPGTTRDDVDSWTIMRPAANDLNTRTGASAAFNRYSRLTFGWERAGQDAPWFMPTFNHDNTDLMTAAAGHARDWIAGGGATDAVTDGATHPGDGTDAYWSSGDDFDNSGGTWPGETITNDAAQNLQQDRAPMTIDQWYALPAADKTGNFWVIDSRTGWAYWANTLQSGQATSYLIDAAEMAAAAGNIPGQYYYSIHVDSQLISSDQTQEFLTLEADGTIPHIHLSLLLQEITNNDGNPGVFEDAQPEAFNFSAMNPGRVFTMAGEQYRYLENMGSGNHMIIRNHTFANTSFAQEEEVFDSWFDGLEPAVQDRVQPVSDDFVTGNVPYGDITFDGPGPRWIPNNLDDFPEVAADVTRVDTGGTSRAFSLSLADVTRLSGPGRAFPNHAERVGGGDTWWRLRTHGESSVRGWFVNNGDGIGGELSVVGHGWTAGSGGLRPALIIR
ncbi:MAG TPA: hypothetical protein DCZ00_06070 [Lactococcus sp.]|uniref:hypothetical protein n=1 Tax=Lactococcus TaxID=1357 RepID=UPI000E85A593|nr:MULTISPECIES: hypothetical protein [Lactococcus]HBC90993.1 hypothetical protein [Lactococcus sp.]